MFSNIKTLFSGFLQGELTSTVLHFDVESASVASHSMQYKVCHNVYRDQCCMWPGMKLQYCTLFPVELIDLSSFQKPQSPPRIHPPLMYTTTASSPTACKDVMGSHNLYVFTLHSFDDTSTLLQQYSVVNSLWVKSGISRWNGAILCNFVRLLLEKSTSLMWEKEINKEMDITETEKIVVQYTTFGTFSYIFKCGVAHNLWPPSWWSCLPTHGWA